MFRDSCLRCRSPRLRGPRQVPWTLMRERRPSCASETATSAGVTAQRLSATVRGWVLCGAQRQTCIHLSVTANSYVLTKGDHRLVHKAARHRVTLDCPDRSHVRRLAINSARSLSAAVSAVRIERAFWRASRAISCAPSPARFLHSLVRDAQEPYKRRLGGKLVAQLCHEPDRRISAGRMRP
jgi:hypothetical protein